MKRYLVVSATIAEGPPNVDGFFDDLADVDMPSDHTAIELATGRVFECDLYDGHEWREVDAVETD